MKPLQQARLALVRRRGIKLGLLLLLGVALQNGSAQVILTADGVTAAYTRIQNSLASAPETPDCVHPEFGPHITQTVDDEIRKFAFVFNMHVTPDNDRCVAFDRQRLEIKTMGDSKTPDYLKGFLGDTVTFRWKFKLPSGFQPSTSFTHIHQLKAFDGDDASPLITLTPRKATPNMLQLIHINSQGQTTILTATPLEPFVGTWVEAYEKVTYGSAGQYSIVIKRLSDGAELFSYVNGSLDLWRTGTTVVRPKWGIYRSLNHPEHLRDEQVLYDRFCLAKGTDDCLGEAELPDFLLASLPAKPTTRPGGVAVYVAAAIPLRGFKGDVSLQVLGLPPGATAQFAPPSLKTGGAAALIIKTSDTTPPGVYSLILDGISGDLSHTKVETLTVQDQR